MAASAGAERGPTAVRDGLDNAERADNAGGRILQKYNLAGGRARPHRREAEAARSKQPSAASPEAMPAAHHATATGLPRAQKKQSDASKQSEAPTSAEERGDMARS